MDKAPVSGTEDIGSIPIGRFRKTWEMEMNDKQFMTVFFGVMGVLTIIFFIIFFIAQIIVPEKKSADEFTNNAIVQRIEPVGKLNYAGINNSSSDLQEEKISEVRESICTNATGEFKTYTVKMLNEGPSGAMVFEPDFIKINTCDSINFEMTDAGHNAVTIAAPKDSLPFDTQYKPSTTVQFDTKGLYLYQCSPHAMMAMAGIIEVSDSNNKSEIEAAIQNFESAVMIPGVKTRISDLLRKNVK
tara:strand:- start:907 stop:1638 length:732 start_codon:yes stop_codon:yes gene_type:complete